MAGVTDNAVWDTRVTAYSRGEMFHTTFWLRLLQQLFGLNRVTPRLMGGDVLVAVFLRSTGTVRTVGSHFFNVVRPQLRPVCAGNNGLSDLLSGLGSSRPSGLLFEMVLSKLASARELERRAHRGGPE